MESELKLLKKYLNNRMKLCEQYPTYQGRHQYFNFTLEKMNFGIDILEKKHLKILFHYYMAGNHL